jgi:hypothetical protein
MKLELTQYEYNIILRAVRNHFYETLEKAKVETPLTKEEEEEYKIWDVITWKESSEREELLLEKLGQFTSHINFRDVNTYLISEEIA